MGAALTKVAWRLHRRLGRYLDRQSHGHHHLNGDGHQAPPHAEETAAFASLLSGLGHSDPDELLFLLQTFLDESDHLTAEDFSLIVNGSGPEVSVEKIVAALDLFTSLGFAEKHYTEDGRVLYEHTHPGLHHDHIICSGCGKTREFHRPDVDNLIDSIACDEGYYQLQHRLVIYGLCPECRRRREDGIRLADTAVNEAVMIVGFDGPEEVKQRLADMGLRRGAKLRILGERNGSIIVLFAGSRLAMGPEMADGLIVRPVRLSGCLNHRIPRNKG